MTGYARCAAWAKICSRKFSDEKRAAKQPPFLQLIKSGGGGRLVENAMFTKEKAAAMGIPPGIMPEGWWVGFKITDNEVWAKIRDGTYSMFSIEGTASREEIRESV